MEPTSPGATCSPALSTGGVSHLAVGLVATLVSLIIGVTWGAVAGYRGGTTDNVMMRFVDMLYSLPFMFFVILLVAYFGRHLVLLFLALGAVQWLTMSRIVRGQMIQLRNQEFVHAMVALGARPSRIIFRHLIPNLLGPIIVYSTLTVPAVMLEEAFLSFLGLGVQPPDSSWGLLAAEGAGAITAVHTAWWLIFFPGLALGLTLFALNFFGDGAARCSRSPASKPVGGIRRPGGCSPGPLPRSGPGEGSWPRRSARGSWKLRPRAS